MPLHQLIFALLCLAACIYAAVRGGAPERIIACAFLVAFVLTNVVSNPQASFFQTLEWRIALVDGGLLAVVMGVALLSTRYWGLPMASMQICDVLGHMAKVLDPTILPQAYFALVAFISYPMIALLAAGTLFHRRRLARWGRDFDWAAQLPPLYRAGWRVDERAAPARARPQGGTRAAG